MIETNLSLGRHFAAARIIRMGCTYKQKWDIYGSLTFIFLLSATALYIAGGVLYHNDRYEKNTHEPNTCEVISSSYYETRCRSGRYGRTVVCFITVWMVTYSVNEEIRIDAMVQHNGLFSIEAAQKRLDQHRVSEKNPIQNMIERKIFFQTSKMIKL